MVGNAAHRTIFSCIRSSCARPTAPQGWPCSRSLPRPLAPGSMSWSHFHVTLHTEVLPTTKPDSRNSDCPDAHARGNRKGLAVPVKGFEALQIGPKPRSRFRVVSHLDFTPADFRDRIAPHASAQRLGHQLPPRQCPRTGTSAATALRISSKRRRNPGQIVVDAHRPTHEHQPLKSSGARWTASPRSRRYQLHRRSRQSRYVQNSLALVGE